jgi:hypothetical protein
MVIVWEEFRRAKSRPIAGSILSVIKIMICNVVLPAVGRYLINFFTLQSEVCQGIFNSIHQIDIGAIFHSNRSNIS